NAEKMGDYLMERLSAMKGIKELRGRGLMIGIEIEESASELRKRLVYEEHVFTGGAGQHTVRLLPALNIGKKEADSFMTHFEKVLGA
ncbi:MAG: aminotransferase class III-fold pyridoxal phosphate-dependent enzyme, partial [Bacteroidaceae bacterium]|nr:aminotransferase class III-fold pyridoxal phosphate-dependent enzyme [Bacteroidaceae bacterium]